MNLRKPAAALVALLALSLFALPAGAQETDDYPPPTCPPDTELVDGECLEVIDTVVDRPDDDEDDDEEILAERPSRNGLARTGGDVLPMAAAGGAALLLGVGLVAAKRRRPSAAAE